jgi:hypothetical protein
MLKTTWRSARTLRVPEEVVRYFEYRQKILESCAALPEPAIAGHFVGGDLDELPTLDSVKHLHQLLQDEKEWDLAPFMRGLHDHLSTPGISDDYYQILIEFAKLPRSAWREVKQRILLCIEKVNADEFTKPYRITDPTTGCGFVFIPVQSKISRESDWPTIRANAIQNFTKLYKYDQKLSKCIGVLVAKDEEYFEILWCLIAHEWVLDPDIQRYLNENYPFRLVRGATVHGYRFKDDQTGEL